MKKILLMTAAMAAIFTTGFSQLSLGLTFGYGFPAHSDLYAANVAATSSTATYESVKVSFGKGVHINLNTDYALNEHLKAGLGINYLAGSKTTLTSTFNGVTDGEEILKGNAFRIIPNLCMTTGGEGLVPYLRAGLILGLSHKGIYEYNDIAGSDYEKYEYSGRLSTGFSGAIGAEYDLGSIALLLEVNYTGNSWAPKRGVLTEYKQNGIDELNTLTTYQKETEYMKEYTENFSTPPSLSEPDQSALIWFPFSSWGFNAGVKLTFGE